MTKDEFKAMCEKQKLEVRNLLAVFAAGPPAEHTVIRTSAGLYLRQVGGICMVSGVMQAARYTKEVAEHLAKRSTNGAGDRGVAVGFLQALLDEILALDAMIKTLE